MCHPLAWHDCWDLFVDFMACHDNGIVPNTVAGTCIISNVAVLRSCAKFFVSMTASLKAFPMTAAIATVYKLMLSPAVMVPSSTLVEVSDSQGLGLNVKCGSHPGP